MPLRRFPNKPVFFALGAVACFHLAFAGLGLNFFIFGYLYCLLCLAETESAGLLLVAGFATAELIFAPQLSFFWGIFGKLAIVLWFIASAWLVAFLMLARACWRRWGRVGLACAAPFLWTGLEFFRGELYYLRFTWLSAGYAFSDSAQLPLLAGLGVYGIGFFLVAVAAVLLVLPLKPRLAAGVAMFALLMIPWPHPSVAAEGKILRMAGVQLEGAPTRIILQSLNALTTSHPGADLLVLSEYTFFGPVPDEIKDWCREHKKFLIIGGTDPVSGHDYFDTAFVVGPAGDIVFKQAKSVPVQFFGDGLSAKEQRVWDSPWGKIGIGICYDASYRIVVDELIRQGAQLLIFPTMDVESWGGQEHRLNGLVGPVRAAEYQVPLFRLASSGISEAINPDGSVQARAGFPGRGDFITAEFQLPARGRLPLDHWLAPICSILVGGILAWIVVADLAAKFRRKANGAN